MKDMEIGCVFSRMEGGVGRGLKLTIGRLKNYAVIRCHDFDLTYGERL